jgi:hypothetical protein
MLPELLPVLERHNEFNCDRETRAKLLRISAASIDRLLKPERRKYELRGRSGTKPGTLMKKQIPIRTFAEWDEQRPGFVEIDLVRAQTPYQRVLASPKVAKRRKNDCALITKP